MCPIPSSWSASANIATFASLVLLGASACQSPKSETKPGAVAANERRFTLGDDSSSAILLRQNSPSEVRVGQEYDGSIDVVNLTDVDLQGVTVTLENISNVHLVGANPEWSRRSNGDVMWTLSELPASSTKTITFRAKAATAGVASNCLSVSYANVLCATTNVVEPMLALVKTAHPEICGTCSDITLTYAVRNSGTGVAENVLIRDTLPDGLVTRDGKSVVELKAGSLQAGMERIYNITANATRRGTFASAAYASADGGLTARSTEPSTIVRQPALVFSCDANNRVFLGRDLDYRITVRNIGDCAATEVLLKAPVPQGSTYLSADMTGRFENGEVAWKLDSLPPGRATTVTMKIHPSAVGLARTVATASAKCVAPTGTECSTDVVGVPAILLEVVDTVDPVEVGGETTFVITATNQGSSNDTNVKVVATLPPAMQFVSGSGATAVTTSGQFVTMSPVAVLAPGTKAEWRIIIKAKLAQDARSRWEMTSDQFKVPIIETESSNFYGDH